MGRRQLSYRCPPFLVMAPTGPGRQESMGFSRECLEAAFSEDTDILRERARRISKSNMALQESLEELQLEQKELREDNARLRSSIELVMAEVNKINIGAANISEPELQESPLDFVARFWERTKPRDTAVPVSDHIGEIRKPLATPADTTAVDFRQTVVDLSEAWSSLLQTDPAVPAASARTSEHVADDERRPSVGSFFSYLLSPSVGCSLGPSSAGPGLPDESEAFLCKATQEIAEAQAASIAAAAMAGAHGDETIEEIALVHCARDAGYAGISADVNPVEEDIQATVLIEAQLTLDDGVTVPCRVSAADRCKEVARRFVDEHSLKAHFEAPLTAFLMDVENNAERFPVQVAMDLSDLREKYSK